MIRWTQRTAQCGTARPFRRLMMTVLLVMCWAAGFGRGGVGIPAASAQSWVNAGTGDWTTPANWNPATVPGPSNSADISNGGTAQISGVAVNGLSALTVAHGNNSSGSLVIQSGGSLTFGGLAAIDVATGSGSIGTVTVTGPGSQLIETAASSFMQVGSQGGVGTLLVSNGGLVHLLNLDLADGATGTANVTGQGSQLIVDNLASVSHGSGNGTLNISAGGSASFNLLGIAYDQGAAAAVNVEGTGSSVTATSFNVGAGVSSRGTLTLSNGGAAISSNTIQLGLLGGAATGTINIGAAPGSAAVLPGSVTAPAVNFGTSTSAINFNHTATNYSFAPDITGLGSVAAYSGTTALTGTNTYSGGTFLNGGILSVSSDANLGAASGALTFNGGTLRYAGAVALVLSPTRTVTLNSGGGTFDIGGGGLFDTLVISSAIGGPGGLTKIGAGNLALGGTNTYGGATSIGAGTLYISGGNAIPDTSAVTVAGGAALGIAHSETIGSLAGAGNVLIPTAGGQVVLTTGADNSSTTFSGTMSNSNLINLTLGLTKIGTGTFTLSGANTYTGPTTVNGGTLAVNGSIASSATTVNAGGTLGGNGTVGNTTINAGGTLAPGSSIGLLTVAGNLVFTAAASYMVEVSPTNADRTNVTGTATLGAATVNANFAAGTYVARQYTIINATGGVNGTFNGPVNTNLPGGFKSSLSYDANNAFLNLALDFTPPPSGPNFGSGLSANQQNVANTLVNYFNTTGGIPMVYGTLTPAGLTQASGELATGSQQTTFDAMNLFLGLLTDPFMNRNGGAGSVPGAPGYAEEGDANAYAATSKTNAFAMFTKAPPVPFVPRWSVWAAGYGGSQSTSGNVIAGSNDTTSSVYGTAVGADYLISPNTIAGFAVAGGGTNFSVAGSGSGRSDLFQAGAYIRHTEGPAYITAALAYGWQDITTNRTLTVAGIDQLRAEFNANTYSGRLEGGYRIIAPWTGGIGITPYTAGQFTTFDLPGYAEQAVVGSSAFALAYAAKSVTDVRSELGIRTDKSFAMSDAVLTLRTRFAWAHDYDPDRSIAATFQALPGASFVVNGAAQAADSALTTASVEMKWRNGWSAAATFEGEFSDVTSSYAGKGVVRYQW